MLGFLGPYLRYTVVYGQESITLFLYLVVLTFYKKKHPLYLVRLISSFVVGIFFTVLLSLIRTSLDVEGIRMLCMMMLHGYLIGILFLCYQESIAEIFLCYAAIVAAKNFSGTLFALLLNMFGINDLYSMSFFKEGGDSLVIDWLIYWAIHAGLLILIYILLRKRESLQDERSAQQAIAIASITLGVSVILSTFTRYYQENDFVLSVLIKVLYLVIYSFILAFRANLLTFSRTSKELQVTEQMLYEEKKHYLEMKTNIDAINMKCHDLRHHLNGIENKLTSTEVEELKAAIEIYDSSIKTGNEIVDTILYQKKLESDKQHIHFKYLVDTRQLGFLPSGDLYSLLSNALNNAFEAVTHVDKQLRMVSLNIATIDRNVHIEVSNYFNPQNQIDSGTSKQDKTHHGYGLKSMEYVVHKHGGKLLVEKEDNIFILSLEIPVISNEKSK